MLSVTEYVTKRRRDPNEVDVSSGMVARLYDNVTVTCALVLVLAIAVPFLFPSTVTTGKLLGTERHQYIDL